MDKTPRMRMLEQRFGEPIEEILRRLYWDENLSLAQVAKKLGPVSGAWPKPGNKTPHRLHRETIRLWMQALGILRRKRALESPLKSQPEVSW